ncbi:GNAT family N-acetyltransferase [Cognatilysobacter lacus]|uniref:L-ornithine N(alpha)-acyltransferase n=1 Tax=Cognatilysobacter lacus TaxID=1643323 RepID=A0A5D8Z2T1_9GAMM|nr:GNAT family N-acyltransferase [Lysobacter lacus]TZF89298.1 GNAT family N-acetyltransferase [Lysobacter lacus]
MHYVSPISVTPGALEVRLARSDDEVRAAQRLRHDVFHAARGHARADALDHDEFDARMDHIVVVDPAYEGNDCGVVGTYRVATHRSAHSAVRGYSSHEFDLAPLASVGGPLMELGRSCVLEPYRTRGVLGLLWRAIGDYVAQNRIDLMFGCASIPGTDVESARAQLSYLHRHHLAPAAIRPRARGDGAIPMPTGMSTTLDDRRALFALEPLIKGYIRLGACIGDGAYVDHDFGTIDVCIVLPTAALSARSVRRYRPTALESHPALAADG